MKIYCDLDGVLADFVKMAVRVTGINPEISPDKKLFWKRLNLYSRTNKVWEDLELMPDAMELWHYISPHNPTILTASGNFRNADAEKKIWVQKKLGDYETIVVAKSKDKADYAAPDAILIDDRPKSIDPWVRAGGIGILHISASDTINQLKQHGL